MTTIEFNHISASAAVEQARGWTASVLLHGVAVAGAFFLMVEIDKPVLREPFQWDVSMVEAPTRSEPQPSEPVVQPPSPPVKPNPPIKQKKQPVTEQLQPQPTPETTVPVEKTQVVKDIVTNAEPVITNAPAESMESQPVTSQAVAVEPVESFNQTVIEKAVPVESTTSPVAHRTVEFRQVRHRQTRADYGWLTDLLRKRIEELKRYPLQARSNHWEGRVVVQAVIKADGTVGDLTVAESSGHAVLDEEALVVMRKASPLTLKHQLEKSQITILVPISYRLEG